MSAKSNAIEHCRRHIERVKAELHRREALGRDPEQLRGRLKTLEALLRLHEGGAARGVRFA